MPLKHRIAQALNQREAQGLYRRRKTLTRQASSVRQANQTQPSLNFSSNDYLGLAQDPTLIAAWQQGLSKYGAGSGASPLVTGHHTPHQSLEARLAEWLGFERALLFSTGFSANQAVLFALLEKGDLLIQDKLNHASLMEAGMLSPAIMRRFAHNDADALHKLLSQNTDENMARLVVTEGVFSMDGDQAPLADIAARCHTSQSWLMVDDAHGCGILGDEGRGSCHQAGIRPDILIVTFGKAFGMQGAAVLCSQDVAEYLIQFARHYVYSTAMPPAQAYALCTACDLVQAGDWRREKLLTLGTILEETLLPEVGLVSTATPIKPVLLGESERALTLSALLSEKGFWVSAIRPPTVPVHQARLRITLTASHSEAHVRELANHLNASFEEVQDAANPSEQPD
ncbi:8-amino-7-oxononanoate synthase [Photobacterium galatheae]|uniref:8-amino-7-oxononanoate synthase n=1 Tax=Photobacterium galatheae TaxID=1654360 RepID=A0A066RT89_9GAMM|nr:8-amino-7-oxononanoate synthase [Photobacterium galatheae]KDM92316.1 8-amino-7-oxononanoate synthase [Photobacterium galatheae]MCM0150503.1 8-amino-7-oxononanoate synthase [Photobacterium galatheae]